MADTTFRNDVVTGIKSFLDTYVAAHPTLLIRAYRTRPPAITDLPLAFVDLRPEAVHFISASLMQREMDAGFIVVDRLTDNDEAMQRFDILIDSLMEALAALVGRVTPGTIFSDVTVSDIDFPQGSSEFIAVRVGLPGLFKVEGRP